MSPNLESHAFHDRVLQTKELALFVIDLPMLESFYSAVGSRHSRKALIVRYTDDNDVIGFGECSCRIDPYYSHEFLDGCVEVVKKFIAPLLLGQTTLFGQFYEGIHKIHGWNFAKSAVLDSIFQTWRKQGQLDPLTAWKSGTDHPVSVGISLGIYQNQNDLYEKIAKSLANGYRRIKLKISPRQDVQYLQNVRREFPETKLVIDANGSFGESDFEWLLRCHDLDLEAIEQPFPWDRLDLCKKLKREAPGLRICLDESVSTIGHLYSALSTGFDELNIKVGRVGGVINAIEIADRCHQEGLPHWVGGMFETGVGRTNNLRFAAKLDDRGVHDLSPPGRYFQEDIIVNEIRMNDKGFIDAPNTAAEIDTDVFAKYLVDQSILSKKT